MSSVCVTPFWSIGGRAFCGHKVNKIRTLQRREEVRRVERAFAVPPSPFFPPFLSFVVLTCRCEVHFYLFSVVRHA